MSGNLPHGVTDAMVDAAVGWGSDHFEDCPCYEDPDDGWCECPEIGADLAAERRASDAAEF